VHDGIDVLDRSLQTSAAAQVSGQDSDVAAGIGGR
jgi:hypothetical protein